MEISARARYVRMSPRKVRLVADLVRGKSVEEALNILSFTNKRPAKKMTQVINSAVANVSQSTNMDVDKLCVKQVLIDGGPTLKRFMPRAMGRATMIRKRTSHITVVLDES